MQEFLANTFYDFIYYILPGNDILQTQTDINLRILKDFNEAGLEMAFPTQTLYATLEGQS
jgi:small-conductance mechanosensitive channel